MEGIENTCRFRMKSLRCVVIVPVYNNMGTVASVISDIRKYCDDVIVVNDGSTDATGRLLEAMDDISLISYDKNKGKGYALKTGLAKAYAMGFAYAITIDADGQHFADDIPVFVEAIATIPDSLIIGARNLTADNMPGKNTFANKFSNFWYKVETGETLSDTQSGFRLYPLRKIQGIRFLSSRYEFEVEIIVRAAWRGVNVMNVPIKVYYPPVEERVSHFRPFKDFFRISVLNTVLVLYAFTIFFPWKFLRSLTVENIKDFFDRNVIHSSESNLRMAASMGWGVFCGIIPIWGYQMVFALTTAHILKLNKIVALVFSNVSVPPMIPFILYGSLWIGAFLMGEHVAVSFDSISFESAGRSLVQYLLGSLVLAVASGLVVMLLSLVMMTVFKRRGADE